MVQSSSRNQSPSLEVRSPNGLRQLEGEGGHFVIEMLAGLILTVKCILHNIFLVHILINKEESALIN